VRNVLLDAGPLIALFAADDKHHKRIDTQIRLLAKAGLRLLTTWPCVVEAAYLLEAPQRFEMLAWMELGGAQVYPFEPQHLGDMVRWMKRYTERGKREMDLADASLYWLASATGVRQILTIDRADFGRYRLPDGNAFELL
jgi:predicted nucleic acid-binding protein